MGDIEEKGLDVKDRQREGYRELIKKPTKSRGGRTRPQAKIKLWI